MCEKDKTFEVTGTVSLPKIVGSYTMTLPADAEGDWPRIKFMLANAASFHAAEVADVTITNVGVPA